jgi:hypothetical protein
MLPVEEPSPAPAVGRFLDDERIAPVRPLSCSSAARPRKPARAHARLAPHARSPRSLAGACIRSAGGMMNDDDDNGTFQIFGGRTRRVPSRVSFGLVLLERSAS